MSFYLNEWAETCVETHLYIFPADILLMLVGEGDGFNMMYEKPGFLRRYWIWLILAIIIAISLLYGVYVWLNWMILEEMYSRKAGIDWFSTVFYHNYTFILAGILGLLFLNPLPGRSDLYEAWESLRSAIRERTYGPETFSELSFTFSLKARKTLWFLWQILKWATAFYIIASINGIPFLGKVTPIFYMMLTGIGDWNLIPRILVLPVFPASSSELIKLMPTLEVEYRLIYILSATILAVIAVRMAAKLIKHFFMERRNLWIRDFFIILTCIVLGIILGSPYWSMDITTLFDYFICLILLIGFIIASIFFHLGGFEVGPALAKRRKMIFTILALAIIGILLVNTGFIAFFKLNWNNNWIQYEWKPLTEKQIAVTRWAAGIDGIDRHLISEIPTGNVTKILSLVRQWDQNAAYTKMKNQIGVNWMTLSDSDIIYIGGREYWAAPTTISYPSRDWISTHLIYTHTSKIIVIDSHSGEFVPVTEAFGIPREPLLYYGEGFHTNVYTNVKGFSEIGNVSYPGEPDYVLSGWQRVLWFLMEGQLGFAFSPPQESINMLYCRDIFQRVGNILIYGLKIDPDAYLVSDGNRVYYAVQVYVDYPMHSGFSASPYLRFFAVVLVDVENGEMKGYIVGKPDGFLVDFYRKYYSSWGDPPEWLIPQLRYPEALLGKHNQPGQLDVDFYFHVEDPFIWRSGSQFYERPGATEVLYVLMVVGNQPHFVGLQLVEFQASPGRNLAGLYVAYGGPQLGRMELYSVPNATTQFIGPSAALQAFETDDYVRTQLTLLTSRRFGNILLYSIGNNLYYFIPVYIEAEIANAVITKMAFIGVIDATTGTQVAVGSDAAHAYYALVGGAVKTEAEERLSRILNLFVEKGLSVVKPTKISGDVWIRVDNATYITENEWEKAESIINGFIQQYAQNCSEVYQWSEESGEVNIGVLVSDRGIVKLYYITIKYA